jgi:glycogen(starch) synthase
LNGRLKESKSNINVVAFIIMPAKNHSYTVEALRSQAEMKQLKQTVNQIQHSIGSRIFEAATRSAHFTYCRSEMPSTSKLLSEEDIVLLKGRILASKRTGLPPIVTHNMVDDANDQILNGLRRCQLFNHKNDNVKVIFHPEFLNANSPLMSIDYEEFLRGCHMGVFPSYYEPWGYTPAECTVMGVPSITTNLSGFGCFMQEVITYPSDYGIYITDRRSKSVEDSLNQLTDYMFDFCQKTRRQRINQRNRCERLSDVLDWKRMGLEYVKARWVALRRKFPDLAAQYDEVHFDDSDDGLSTDFQAGYESDGLNAASREDLSSLGKRQKVPRPMSIPGSPTKAHEEFLDNIPVSHLFDESEKGKVNVVQMLDELKNLGIRGAPSDYLKKLEEQH